MSHDLWFPYFWWAFWSGLNCCPVYNVSFSLAILNNFFRKFWYSKVLLYCVCACVFFCFSYLEFTKFLESLGVCFSPNLGNVGLYYFKYIFFAVLISFSSLSGTSTIWMVVLLIRSHSSLRLYSFLHQTILFLFSDQMYSTDLFSSSVILPSFVPILLLSPASDFLKIYTYIF